MQRKWRLAAAAAALLALLGTAVIAGLAAALPDTLYTDEPAAELRIASLPYLSARKKQGAVPADSTAPDTSSNVTLALFGVVPVKTVRAVTTARRTVQLCGTPFGVKLFSDGALVVAFSDRYTALGSENPAKAAGLRLGDLIISANGQPVRSNEDLTSAHTGGGRCAADCALQTRRKPMYGGADADSGRERLLQGGHLGAGFGGGYRDAQLYRPTARHLCRAGPFHQRCRHRCRIDTAIR